MQNKTVTLVLVVIIGVLVGVGIVGKQARDPILKELLTQQMEIHKSQKAIEKKLTSEETLASARRVEMLEQKITLLEAQIKALEDVLKQAKAGAQQRPGPPQEDFSKQYDIPVDHSPIRGRKDAPVTIVEFVDFECPFCARFHPPVVGAIEAFPDDVNYMIKNFPLQFHPNARSAAKAAFAAGEQGKYWEMTEELLKNGRVLSEAKYEDLAKQLGLDVKQFLKDFKEKDAQWEEYIQKDMALAQKVNVRGTPTFYINGRKTLARDLPSFKKTIEKILKEQK